MKKIDKLSREMRASYDPQALDLERETHINFDDENIEEISIDSGQRMVIKSLLENENFKMNYGYTKDNGKDIIYLAGKIPLNCLRIKPEPTGKNELNYILKH